MKDTEPGHAQIVRMLAVIGVLISGVHALAFWLFAPPLVLYFVPPLLVCWRLLALRRWAALALIIATGAVVILAAKPLFAGRHAKDWYTSLSPLYLVEGISFCVPLILITGCSWRHLKAGL